MAPLKRKRHHDEPDSKEAAATRRATRQTLTAPLPVQPDPEPRRRRPRASTAEKSEDDDRKASQAVNGVSHHNESSARGPRRDGASELPPKPARTTRHGGGVADTAMVTHNGDENAHPSFATEDPRPQPLARLSGQRPRQPLQAHRRIVGSPNAMGINTAALPPTRQQKQLNTAPTPEKPNSRSDRNIDKVVLGDICFRAWYPSYYGKEVLGDISGNSAKSNANAGNANAEIGVQDGGAKTFSRKERDGHPILDRLYVCPCCFKYSKELVTWWEHVRACELKGRIPGEKIYIHPRGKRVLTAHAGQPPRGPKKKKGDPGTNTTQLLQDEGEWSIWEVDGGQDVLFCQDLSLFAKLFLDNKSVFFDVTGFNYFLLVYTPTVQEAAHGTNGTGGHDADHHIVGFFSKEKMSWDNNNLACILIFPPWQRKGLGALLMGISYEISKREGILGGPEKPISDLGKKGYKRFWAGEIARWLLSLDISNEAETVIDVNDCSTATWIAPEDCLTVLRDMNLVEEAGTGPPKGEDLKEEEAVEGEGVEPAEPKLVPRVRLSRAAVRNWIAANGISLERTCDPEGFVKDYAPREAEVEEEE